MNRATFVMLTEKEKLKDILQNSLAVSLRFDGSVDRNQIDNEHVLAKTVNQKGEEPDQRGGEGALKAIENAVEKSVEWDSLFPNDSSLASDGTNLNSGSRSGIWARLQSDASALGKWKRCTPVQNLVCSAS